jgi:co-chaperonin GroES (HSP10)
VTHPLIEKTWAELGFRIRPLNRKVFIRTETRPYKTAGGIIIPESARGIYSVDRSKIDVELYARVLSVGPRCREIKEGDRIFISRLYFAWIRKLADGNFVGYLEEENVFGFAAEDEVKEEVGKFDAAREASRQGASVL